MTAPDLEAPASLARRFTHRAWTEVWSNQRARTWRLDASSGETQYLKLSRNIYPTIPQEVARMRWARPYVPVPRVIETGGSGGLDWMVTAALPGVSAVDPALLGNPGELVPVLARGLRVFHESLPVERCPFDFRLEAALEHVRQQLEIGVDLDDGLHPEHRHLRDADLLAELERLRPATEDLVVCHGDYCFPNVLVEDGKTVGFLDLGELGVADRWWDLAVATWSVTWNVGPGWEGTFLEAYGTERDHARIAFYRLLYDLVS